MGKPVVVEETFPLKCSGKVLEEFMDASQQDAVGWISFYWGQPPEELRRTDGIAAAMMLDWLERFKRRATALVDAPLSHE